MIRAAANCPRWIFDCRAVEGQDWLVGVDEAGRGALAGPVVAGAVAVQRHYFQRLPDGIDLARIRDSKQIAEPDREELFDTVSAMQASGLFLMATAESSVAEIDTEDILGATCIAMRRALDRLHHTGLPRNEYGANELFQQPGQRVRTLVDGIFLKRLKHPHEGIRKGDDTSHVIALASIAAKVTRDRLMRSLHCKHESFNWYSNKGYGTPPHRKALLEQGPSPFHRKHFIRKLMDEAHHAIAE